MRLIPLLLVLAAALSSLTGSAQKTDAQAWAKIARYAADNTAVTAAPKYVFMGNSITEFWPEKDPGFFVANNIVGRGVAGQTSAQMLLRFVPDVVNLKPKGVLILAGINDIAENAGPYSEEFTMDNIRAMVLMARSAGIVPILATVLPASSIYWNKDVTDVSEKIQSLNGRIKTFAVEQGLYCIDWYPGLVGLDARSINPDFSDDGLHPNETGYAVMEALALPSLNAALLGR